MPYFCGIGVAFTMLSVPKIIQVEWYDAWIVKVFEGSRPSVNAGSRITGRLSIKEVRSVTFLIFWITMSFSLFRKVSLTKMSYEWLGQVCICMYIYMNNFSSSALLSAVLRSRRFALQKLSTKILPISVSEEAALCKSFHDCLGLF